MADHNWYRRKTWTEKDREEFFSRLRRSRTAFNKAQYTRIQAGYIAGRRDRTSYLASLELLDMIIAEWPDTPELASVQLQRAQCLIGLGDLRGAIDAFRLVFEAQRARKNYLTMANLDFGWLVATRSLTDHYDEALRVLDEFPANLFAAEHYKSNAIRALIHDARGMANEAKIYAARALSAAEITHSGFRYHPDVGLVTSPDEQVQDRLRRITLNGVS